MTSSRETVLKAVRRSLQADSRDRAAGEAVEARLAEAPAGVVPARARRPHEEQIGLFIEMAEAVDATVERVDRTDAVPGRVADYLRSRNLAHSIVHGADAWIEELPWQTEPALERRQGRAMGDEQAGFSRAFGGIAESGTLVLTSGPDNPTTINFLPEYHIVAIRAEDIDGDYETVLARIRESYGKGRMPRLLNMITGPSRSADIQQTLLLGAHGPRRLHIIVVG